MTERGRWARTHARRQQLEQLFWLAALTVEMQVLRFIVAVCVLMK